MNSMFRKISAREWTLGALTLSAVILTPVVTGVVLPLWGHLETTRSAVKTKGDELWKLQHFVNRREEIEHQFAQLGETAIQTKTDEQTLSQFLRQIDESLARFPRLALGSMKPQLVEGDRDKRVYRVRLSTSGTLADTVAFVERLAEKETLIGVDSFALQGVQGGLAVDATMTLRIVRFTSIDTHTTLKA